MASWAFCASDTPLSPDAAVAAAGARLFSRSLSLGDGDTDDGKASTEVQRGGRAHRAPGVTKDITMDFSETQGLQLGPQLRVLDVVPGGAAERRGVQVGWQIVAVNDVNVSGTESFAAVTAPLKSSSGSHRHAAIAKVTFRLPTAEQHAEVPIIEGSDLSKLQGEWHFDSGTKRLTVQGRQVHWPGETKTTPLISSGGSVWLGESRRMRLVRVSETEKATWSYGSSASMTQVWHREAEASKSFAIRSDNHLKNIIAQQRGSEMIIEQQRMEEAKPSHRSYAVTSTVDDFAISLQQYRNRRASFRNYGSSATSLHSSARQEPGRREARRNFFRSGHDNYNYGGGSDGGSFFGFGGDGGGFDFGGGDGGGD